MTLKTLQERLCAPLFAMHDFLALRLGLTLQWAGEHFLRALRAGVCWSYPTFLLAMILAMLLVLFRGLTDAVGTFLRDSWEAITSARELSYRSWKEDLPHYRAERKRRDRPRRK